MRGREENLSLLEQGFYHHKLLSDLACNQICVFHHSVQCEDVAHHQTQAVQLEFQMVIWYTRLPEGVQKLLSDGVAQVFPVICGQTCHAVQLYFLTVHASDDLPVECIYHTVGASDDRSRSLHT